MITPFVAIVLLLTTGCAGVDAGPARPSLEPLSPAEAERLTSEALASYAERLQAAFPGIELPAVAPIRFIEPQEYGGVFAECVTEAGFPATPTEDNGIGFAPVPDTQAEAQSVALYVCQAQYPTNPNYLRPFTEEQLSYIYVYNRQVLIPCIRDLGVEVPPLPSEQIFKDTFVSETAWSPYAEALELPQSEFQNLIDSCPQFPEDIWG